MTSNYRDLSIQLEALTLHQNVEPSECPATLFQPPDDCPEVLKSLTNVPRYLFRVFSPRSAGFTDDRWAKSKDAIDSTSDYRVDLLARTDKGAAADMLNRHLRWRGRENDNDNLVSWTSSLVFALQYMFYRHYNEKDGSSFDQIHLCVIDTSLFPTGAFVRDMDIMQSFVRYNDDLANLQDLRRKGVYYFGEYLSQGALRLNKKCRVVRASDIIAKGLYDIRSEFSAELPPRDTPWAKQVLTMRQSFFVISHTRIDVVGIKAALRIAELFGGEWEFPVAAYFVGLRSIRGIQNGVVEIFRRAFDRAKYRSPAQIKVVKDQNLPEVQEAAAIIRLVWIDFYMKGLSERIGLEESFLAKDSEGLVENGYITLTPDGNSLELNRQAVLEKLEKLKKRVQAMA